MKPKALRLAFDLDFWPMWAGSEAAAELRRLHAANVDCTSWYHALRDDYKTLRAECDALRSDLATLRAENYNTQSLLAGAEAERDALRDALRARMGAAELMSYMPKVKEPK